MEVVFEFDASGLKEGSQLVAFEQVLTADGNLVAAHQDIDDEGQTVVVDNPETPEKPGAPYGKTGADAPDASVITIGIAALIGALIAGAGAVALARTKSNRKRLDDDDAEEVEE